MSDFPYRGGAIPVAFDQSVPIKPRHEVSLHPEGASPRFTLVNREGFHRAGGVELGQDDLIHTDDQGAAAVAVVLKNLAVILNVCGVDKASVLSGQVPVEIPILKLEIDIHSLWDPYF